MKNKLFNDIQVCFLFKKNENNLNNKNLHYVWRLFPLVMQKVFYWKKMPAFFIRDH